MRQAPRARRQAPVTQLRIASATEAELLLAASVSGRAKVLVEHAFRLSAGALRGEPEEWAAQLLARLRNDTSRTIRRVLKLVAESREGCWLKPVCSPLIAAGGPIEEIVDVGAPYDYSKALILSEVGTTITSFSDSSFRTWDIAAGREVRRVDLPIRWARGAISDPPLYAVVMAAQQNLLLVDLDAAAAEVIFSGSVMETIAISADGAWAVTASVPPDWDYETHEWTGTRIFRLFDLRKRGCVRTWESDRGYVWDLALSADGKFLATASRDQTAQLVDLRSGETVGCWRSTRALRAVDITRDGRRIAYCSDGGVLTVRNRDGGLVGRYKGGSAEQGCLRFSRDGEKVVIAGDGGWVSRIDLRKKTRGGPFLGTQPYLTSLAIDAEARHAVTGERGRQLVRWDLASGGAEEDGTCWIFGIWASADRAIVRGDGLWLWDLSTGRRTALRSTRQCEIASAPSSGIWAMSNWSDSGGGRLRIGKWGSRPGTVLYKSKDLMSNLQISRSGTRLVAGVHPRGCLVLEIAEGRTVLQKDDLAIGARPYLSPSGRYLLLCSIEGLIEVIDLETRKVLRRGLPEPSYGTVLFTTDDDCVVIRQGFDTALLNWRTNELRILFEGGPSSISEDGRWMVTVSNNRKMILWMLPEERRMATFTLDAPVLHTALSSEGRYLVAGDQNGAVHILERRE